MNTNPGRPGDRRPGRFQPLTVEQEERVRTARAAGATRDEAAAAAGITRSRLDTRLRDQLADVRVGQGRRERRREYVYPTPEEIEQRKLEVQARWSEEDRAERRLNFSGPAD